MPHPAILPTGRTLPPFLAPPDPISVFTQGWELGRLQAEGNPFLTVPLPLAADLWWMRSSCGCFKSLSWLKTDNTPAPGMMDPTGWPSGSYSHGQMAAQGNSSLCLEPEKDGGHPASASSPEPNSALGLLFLP